MERPPQVQAGCVCVRKGRVLLISSRKHPDVWIFPKGTVEKREAAEAAAVREAFEEAGVRGRVVRALGEVYDQKRHAVVWVFVLIVDEELDDFDEKGQRKHRWESLEAAQGAATRPIVVEALRRLGQVWPLVADV